MSTWKRFVALAAAILATASFAKETLYATSLHAQIGGAASIAGNLYVVDPSTASATLVGSIRLGDSPVGVLALAAHPKTGVVYGITAGLGNVPRSLIEIDLQSATAQLVARLPVRGSDIGFDDEGTLYMWAPDLHQLVSIDLETATPQPIGNPLAVAGTGAVAIGPGSHEALVAVNGGHGRLMRIDVRTGEAVEGPQLKDAPYEASIDNLTHSAAGVLYGVNSDGGSPSKSALVMVDPANGMVSKIGPLPDDVRGLIFATEHSRFIISKDTLRFWLLVGLGMLAVGIIVYAMRRA
jgi:hypothetical protein